MGTNTDPTTAPETAAAPLDMSSEAGRDGARETQESLTQSVGTRLTREDRDAEVPRWKRWLGRG
jgi:hypothetical protein